MLRDRLVSIPCFLGSRLWGSNPSDRFRVAHPAANGPEAAITGVKRTTRLLTLAERGAKSRRGGATDCLTRHPKAIDNWPAAMRRESRRNE